jgi:hypothetical protein
VILLVSRYIQQDISTIIAAPLGSRQHIVTPIGCDFRIYNLYIQRMVELEWDDAKRQANIAKHGVDFVEVFELLADKSQVVLPDDRRAYGEARFVVLAANKTGGVRVLVMTPRADRIRVISVRPANGKERGFYERQKIDQSGSSR